MNLIRIRGSLATLVGLDNIDDLAVIEHSHEALSSGDFQIGAYATDRAVTEIETRGAVVEVLVDNAALDARLDALYAIIEAKQSNV